MDHLRDAEAKGPLEARDVPHYAPEELEGPKTAEARLRESEARMSELLEKERRLMEEKAAQTLVREQRYKLDKEMTVKQIVEEEKQIIQERFKDDVERLQTANMKQVQALEQHAAAAKNKSEKLQRVLVEKEAALLELQAQHARLETELKTQLQQKDLLEAKVRALAQFASEQ